MARGSPQHIREQVWQALRRVARPDSRFHWNFAEFIPDFEGSDRCAETIRALPEYRGAQFVFVTPDNNLELMRAHCLSDGKTLLVSTYGIARGFLLVEAGVVPPEAVPLAATLDGLEHYGRPATLADIQARSRLDLLITGASAINHEGVRFGKGHGYFDLEWGIFTEVGAATAFTPIIAVVHDCQLVDVRMEVSPHDTIVDVIVTPTRLFRPQTSLPRPSGIVWEKVTSAMLEAIPPLAELQKSTSSHSD